MKNYLRLIDEDAFVRQFKFIKYFVCNTIYLSLSVLKSIYFPLSSKWKILTTLFDSKNYKKLTFHIEDHVEDYLVSLNQIFLATADPLYLEPERDGRKCSR